MGPSGRRGARASPTIEKAALRARNVVCLCRSGECYSGLGNRGRPWLHVRFTIAEQHARMITPPTRTHRWSARLGATLSLALVAGGIHLASGMGESPAAADVSAPLTIPIDGGAAAIDPGTLVVTFVPTSGPPVVWSAPTPSDLGQPTSLAVGGEGTLSWGYANSDLRVQVSEQDGRLGIENRTAAWALNSIPRRTAPSPGPSRQRNQRHGRLNSRTVRASRFRSMTSSGGPRTRSSLKIRGT